MFKIILSSRWKGLLLYYTQSSNNKKSSTIYTPDSDVSKQTQPPFIEIYFLAHPNHFFLKELPPHIHDEGLPILPVSVRASSFQTLAQMLTFSKQYGICTYIQISDGRGSFRKIQACDLNKRPKKYGMMMLTEREEVYVLPPFGKK